jgi:multidrug efflux pump subunit AcrB
MCIRDSFYTGPAGLDHPPGNGEAAVTLAIAKKKGSNGVRVANDIVAMVESLEGRLIPSNVHVTVTRNHGKTANDKVNELLADIFMVTLVDPIVYHKDLRPVEYVVGDVAARLGAPIYGMLAVQDKLKHYVAPDGYPLTGHFFGPPHSLSQSGYAWTGEWTVTVETFTGLGIAFCAALFFIYMSIVGEFRNFTLSFIMAPIPLTMLGIIPGHWLIGAEFTAISMIGFIALAGIIVRNSICWSISPGSGARSGGFPWRRRWCGPPRLVLGPS